MNGMGPPRKLFESLPRFSPESEDGVELKRSERNGLGVPLLSFDMTLQRSLARLSWLVRANRSNSANSRR